MGRCFQSLCSQCSLVDRTLVRHISLLVIVTFLVVLPIASLRLRFSLYYYLWPHDVKSGQVKMRSVNDARLGEAEKYLSTLQQNEKSSLTSKVYGNADSVADVGITIITVSRNRHVLDQYEPKYLTQVVAKFLQLLENRHNVHLSYKLFICNVDDDPKSYFEVQHVAKFAPTFTRFSNRNLNGPYHRSTDQTLEKEKDDYVYCGEETLKQNVSNIFLVEDDALPHDDLINILDHIVPKFITSPKRTDNIAFLKFYHPDRLLGYISLEPERLPELFGMSVILSAILVSVYIKKRPSLSSRKNLLWFIFFVYSFALFLVVGRQNVLEVRRMSKHLYQVTPAPTCCTPAILFTKDGFIKIANFLKSVTCKARYGKDTAIDEFRAKSGLIARMVQPNLFTHIGMYSSLRDQILDPFIV